MTDKPVNSGMLPKNWIFLRGLAREKRHWGDFPDVFRRRFPDVRVEMIDLPGIGENKSVTSPVTISGITDLVRTEAKQLFPVDRFAILALSLGGMVAIDWMREFAGDLDGVVLVNSSSRDSAFYLRLRFQVWPNFIRAIMHTDSRGREHDLMNILINSEAARERAEPIWGKIAQEQASNFAVFSRQILAAMGFRGLDDTPETPVLLLNSLGDRLVDPACSEALQQKYRWKMERHAWGGHDLAWDDPLWICDKVERFFA